MVVFRSAKDIASQLGGIVFWLMFALALILVALVILLLRTGVEYRIYDTNNPRDQKKLREIIQGGPDERYIHREKF